VPEILKSHDRSSLLRRDYLSAPSFKHRPQRLLPERWRISPDLRAVVALIHALVEHGLLTGVNL